MEERKETVFSKNTDSFATVEDFRAYIQNTSLMNQIVSEMKEIPELPSEKPKDIQGLREVKFPPEGGVLTYMDGYEVPFKGFPFFSFVDTVDTIKKIQRGVLSSLFHSLRRRRKWQLALLVFVPWIFGDLVAAYLGSIHRMMIRIRLKPNRYCTSMRELHRAFSVEWHDDTLHEREYRLMLRDVLCMFLEFDNAYRFRLQDIIVHLDKQKLEENPSKEVLRLFELLSKREKTQEIKDTWKLVKTFLPLYLRLNKSVRKWLVSVLLQLDLEQMALSKEDKVFCMLREDYSFGFLSPIFNPNKREVEYFTKRLALKKEADDKKKGIRSRVSSENQELEAAHKRALDDLNFSPEERQIVLEAVPALIHRNREELQVSLAEHQKQMNMMYQKREDEILEKNLPPRYYQKRKAQIEERIKIDQENEVVLKTETDRYDSELRKLIEDYQ